MTNENEKNFNYARGLTIRSLTALQLKALEDFERRLSGEVWRKCFAEGEAAYAEYPESLHYVHAYGDRDMTVAYELGWYRARERVRVEQKFADMDRKRERQKQPKPRKRKRKVS